VRCFNSPSTHPWLARFLAKNGPRASVPQCELGKAGVQFWADTTTDMKQLLDPMHKENPELRASHLVTALIGAHTSAHPELGQYVQRRPSSLARLESLPGGRPCAPRQARTMPASYALLGHDELQP
jgi:hypothetical protein